MIQILDKYFEPYISENEVEERVGELAQEIESNYHGKSLYVLIVLNGAFRFASDLVRKINLPMEIGFMKLSSYAGEKRKELQLDYIPQDLKGKNVLIVEDILDTGYTLEAILQLLVLQEVNSKEIVTLLSKPDAKLCDVNADYCGFEISDRFVVGYGLDYNGFGRNINGIFQIKK